VDAEDPCHPAHPVNFQPNQQDLAQPIQKPDQAKADDFAVYVHPNHYKFPAYPLSEEYTGEWLRNCVTLVSHVAQKQLSTLGLKEQLHQTTDRLLDIKKDMVSRDQLSHRAYGYDCEKRPPFHAS
jgi:hypothetical protein